MALLDIYWAFLALTPVAPDIYVAAAHAAADRVVPRRQQPESELASLAPHPPPYSLEEIHALQALVSQRARQRGFRSRVDTLQITAITGATRRALRLPTVPLQPFAGLAPRPDAQPATREARLAEVNAQAAYVQEDRWVRVDVQAVSDPASWEPWFTAFRPEHDLPMRLVLQLVRESNPTWSRAGTAAFAQELSRLPLLHWPAICTSARKARSLATALDHLPARLFALSSGGLLLGVRAVLAQAQTGVTSVADLIVQYALYKDTGARNVLKSYRPFSVGSAIAGVEGGCAQRRLNDTAELAAMLTPDLLAYRQGVQQPFVALAARAAATLCLVQYANVALAKWDESDVYFRVVRGQTTQVMQLAAPAWDFGSWSVQFYGRQLICPLTCGGFPEPVAPQEGHNKGCRMAGEGFNSTQAVVSAAMPKPDDVRIPSPRGPLPASHICFSDDRLFVRPSLQRAEHSIIPLPIGVPSHGPHTQHAEAQILRFPHGRGGGYSSSSDGWPDGQTDRRRVPRNSRHPYPPPRLAHQALGQAPEQNQTGSGGATSRRPPPRRPCFASGPCSRSLWRPSTLSSPGLSSVRCTWQRCRLASTVRTTGLSVPPSGRQPTSSTGPEKPGAWAPRS